MRRDQGGGGVVYSVAYNHVLMPFVAVLRRWFGERETGLHAIRGGRRSGCFLAMLSDCLALTRRIYAAQAIAFSRLQSFPVRRAALLQPQSALTLCLFAFRRPLAHLLCLGTVNGGTNSA